MEHQGHRGSSTARIDDKGRLKVPAIFRGFIEDQRGPDVFVTSLTGKCVRIYPMAVWIEVEQNISRMPGSHPLRLKFLDRVNYYGQTAELDGQGRVLIPAHLRESASIVGEVRVIGRINHLEVWNEAQFLEKLQSKPWTDDDDLGLSEHGN